MLKHKVGDTVRIQSKEWLDAQERDEEGDLCFSDGVTFFNDMFCYAGKVAKIARVIAGENFYRLDIDNAEWLWEDWMFDPDFRPEDAPLSAEAAILAMVGDGETLYDKDGAAYFFNKEEGCFYWTDGSHGFRGRLSQFNGLCRLPPPKRTRDMTRWEVLAWVSSEESNGWLVKNTPSGEWCPPMYTRYLAPISEYQRARLLPDLSGIDEDTIQGFEVEE